jgi:uncharacterized SAM-binding protein YcdF (DUF218 family)
MFRKLSFLAALIVVVYLSSSWVFTQIGEFLVVDDDPIESADAVVVLSTGVDYLPRLIQAANLYQLQLVKKVVINGNRKTDIHHQLEAQGFVSPNEWHDGPVAVLKFLGVNTVDVIIINAEDAYDTVSEAQYVGPELMGNGIRKLIITTSKFHTRRAIAIWKHLYSDQFQLQIVSAKDDPFKPNGWWHHGRQIRQVLSEYGAWVYFWGKQLKP